VCTHCRDESYCGVACQKADWKRGHKERCLTRDRKISEFENIFFDSEGRCRTNPSIVKPDSQKISLVFEICGCNLFGASIFLSDLLVFKRSDELACEFHELAFGVVVTVEQIKSIRAAFGVAEMDH
jgi:hypothetical protein